MLQTAYSTVLSTAKDHNMVCTLHMLSTCIECKYKHRATSDKMATSHRLAALLKGVTLQKAERLAPTSASGLCDRASSNKHMMHFFQYAVGRVILLPQLKHLDGHAAALLPQLKCILGQRCIALPTAFHSAAVDRPSWRS